MSAGEHDLVGRDAECAALLGLVRETAAGTGGCTVVTGPPGMGKSSLLGWTLQRAGQHGLATAAGRADELDRLAPLVTLTTALRSTGSPSLNLSGSWDPDEQPVRSIDRIRAALEDQSRDQPLLVVLDDVQWADELSVLALRLLVPALASSPVRWLLARRTVPTETPVQATLDWLVGEGAQEVVLGPLDRTALARLCATTLGAEPDLSVLALLDRGDGNPFIWEQILLAWRSAGQVLVTGDRATVVGSDLPAGFVSAVHQRLRPLTEDTRWLLRAGAVLGRPLTLPVAAELLDRQPLTLAESVQEALAAGVMVEGDSGLSFGHDLWREAIYDGTAATVRSALHRRAAVLAEADGRFAEAAEHISRSGPAGGAAAARTLIAAAEKVSARAPSTAADFLCHALSILDGSDDRRPALTASAVGLLAACGRLGEATSLGESSLHSGLSGEHRARLLLGLAEALKHAGQNRAAVDHADRALAIPSVQPGIQARLQAIRAHALLFVDDGRDAEAAGLAAERIGTAHGENGAAVFGLTARSMVAHAAGRLTDALNHARRAVDLAERDDGDARHRHPRIWLGDALVALDRFAEADQVYTEGRREAERLGTAWSLPLWHFYHALMMMASGRLGDAIAEADAGLRVAEQITAWQLSLPLAGLLARLAVVCGQPAAARNQVRFIRRLQAGHITAAPEEVEWSIFLVQELEGRPAEAMRTLRPLLAALPERVQLLVNDPGAAAVLVRTAIATGDQARAATVVAAATELARRVGTATLTGAAAHAAGLLERDRETLLTAVDLLRDSPRPLVRIAAMEDAAQYVHRAGHRADAIALVEEALGEATACGADRPARRLRRTLTRLGTTGRMAHSVGPTGPLTGLSPAELGVARLVAQGLTNRQVADQLNLSPHTVDSHLRHAFGKLGINRRYDLRRIVESADD